MAKIHIFNTPLDVDKETMGNYFVNIYDSTGEFVESRHYEWFTGTEMMDEIKDLKKEGYCVEW